MNRPSARFLSALLPAFLLLPAMMGCQGDGSGGGRSGPVLESRNLSQKDISALQRLEQLWVRDSSEYQAEKLQLLAANPAAGPWLAKSLTNGAINAYDHMVKQHVRVRDFMRSEQASKSFLGRTRIEMQSLGNMGRDAIIVYLLRSDRAQIRTVGVILFETTPEDELFPSLEAEFQTGNLNSARALIQICAERPGSKRAMALLQRATGHTSWVVRGLAVRPWSSCMRVQKDEGAAKALWDFYEKERDEFVRKQCLLAIADLKDSAQVRPLIDLVDTLERQGQRMEAQGAVKALEALTGAKPGKTHSDWLKWLNG